MSITRLRQAQWAARAAWAASITLAAASQADDWTFYRKDLAGTANAGEPLTLVQAGALEINRQIFLGGDIFSNPVVANGTLYYTSGAGYLHAVSLADPAKFTEKWKKPMYASGLLHFPDSDGRGCEPTPRRQPPVGAPAVVGTTVFAPGGDGFVYSFDPSGNQNWATKIADVNNLGEFLWSSIFPVNGTGTPADGKLYIGVSSLHDCLLVPGRLVALDQITGAVVGTWWGDTNHLPGAGIWTQPAYDAVSKRLFVTTGTLAEGKTTTQQPWADAFVAIDPDAMTTLDWFSPVPSDSYYADFDFGGSPTLYDSLDGLRHFIAATNKNGWVYALDRDHLANGLVWKYQISGPGTSPDLGESSIVSAPYNKKTGTLFVAGAKTADGLHPGAIAALDAFTGVQKWIFYPEGFVLPAMTVTDQVLFAPVSDAVTGRGKLYVLDQATGAVVSQFATANMFGQPSWANGALYFGDGVGSMYELVPNPLGPQPDFDLTVDQVQARTILGGTTTTRVYAIPKNGFNAPVSLTVTTPSATPTLDPATLPGTGQIPYSSTMSLATSISRGPLYESVKITGTGGGRTRSTAVWMVVSDFALSATAASAVQGSSATSTVKVAPKYGFSAPINLTVSGLPAGTTTSFDPSPATTRSTLTLRTSSATPPGTYQVQVSGTVPVSGTAGTLTRSTTFPLVVTDFTLSATDASAVQGSSATSAVTVSPNYGFAAPVNLSVSGLPTGTTASFDPSPATTRSTLTLRTSATTPPGTYQLQISAAAGTLTRSCTFPLVVTPPADFQVAVGPSSQQAAPGGHAIYTVTIPMSGTFSQPVTLSVTGLPPGATYAFGAPQGNTQVLTVTLANDTSPGAWTFSILATGGGLTRVVSASLTVVAGVAQSTPKTGCGSGGPAGLSAALIGLFLAVRLSRRRQGAQPCAALESSVVSE